MSKNYHSLVKHLSFLSFYLFSENFILYIHTLYFVHILSSPLTESFQIHPSLLSQIHGFPSS